MVVMGGGLAASYGRRRLNRVSGVVEQSGSMCTQQHGPGHLSSNLVGPMPRRHWGLGDKHVCGNACKRTRKIPHAWNYLYH